MKKLIILQIACSLISAIFLMGSLLQQRYVLASLFFAISGVNAYLANHEPKKGEKITLWRK